MCLSRKRKSRITTALTITITWLMVCNYCVCAPQMKVQKSLVARDDFLDIAQTAMNKT